MTALPPRIRIVALSALCAACPGKEGLLTDATTSATDTPGTETSTSGAPATDASTSASTDTSTDTSATDTSTDTSATGTSTTGATETSTGEPVEPFCALSEENFPRWPKERTWFPFWGYPVDDSCVLESLEEVDGETAFVFDCPVWEMAVGTDAFEVRIAAGPVPDPLPAVGATYHVLAKFGMIDAEIVKQNVIVRDDAGLVYASVYDIELVPFIGGVELLAPFVATRADPCPMLSPHGDDPTEAVPGDEWTCQQYGRSRLRGSIGDGEPVEFADGESATVSGDGLAYAVSMQLMWRVTKCIAGDLAALEAEMVVYQIAAQAP